MSYVETYNARVAKQQELDDLFPKGVFMALLEEWGFAMLTSLQMTVGRVFCSNAYEEPAGTWWYQLLFDQRPDTELAPGETWQPFAAWVGEFDIDLPTVEAVNQLPEEGRVEILRMYAVGPGSPEAPPAGHREFLTRLREADLFPHGVNPIRLGPNGYEPEVAE